MRNTTPDHQGKVVQFPVRHKAEYCLTSRDKQDVAGFREQAAAAGYDALMIHIISDHDGPGTRDYVAAYREGEAWSSWGFARNGDVVCSWNALTSKDSGTFGSMAEALECTLAAVAKHAAGKRAKKH